MHFGYFWGTKRVANYTEIENVQILKSMHNTYVKAIEFG